MPSTDKTNKPGGADERLQAKLRARLRELRISAREASRRAGFNLGYVGDILDGRSRTPDADNILRLAESLDMDAADLLGDSDVPAPPPPQERRVWSEELRPVMRMIPLMGAPLPMNRQFVTFTEEPIGRVPCPSFLMESAEAFAAIVPNNASAPRFFSGETIFVQPGATPKVGDFIWLQRTDGTIGIAQLAALDADSLSLFYWGLDEEQKRAEVAYSDIVGIHKILATVA